MLTKRITRHGALLLAISFAMLTVVSAGAAAVRGADRGAATTITIWTDQDRQTLSPRSPTSGPASRGVTIKVVLKGFGDIRDGLKTIDPANAPDVIVGAHDWTGQLAADGLVLPLYPSKATRAQFPKYALDAFSYGTAVNKLYAAPVVIENIGLVVNTKLAKVPTTFAQLESAALKFKKKSSGNLAIAVPQGAAGDAYHMYPFFSGLGGYVFGRNKAGNLDASDIGVANKKFTANASLIDKWNKEGLINSKVDYNTAKTRSSRVRPLSGSPAVGVGHAEAERAEVPRRAAAKIKFRSVPFLGVQGFHGHEVRNDA